MIGPTYREDNLLRSLESGKREKINTITERILILIKNPLDTENIIDAMTMDDKEINDLPIDFRLSLKHWKQSLQRICKMEVVTTNKILIDIMSFIFNPKGKFIFSYYKINRLMFVYCAWLTKNIYDVTKKYGKEQLPSFKEMLRKVTS